MTELDQLRRLVEARAKATAGEWQAKESNILFVGINTDDPMKCSGICMAYGSREVARPNMDLIALAGSTDLRAILAAWERDREELEELRKPDLWWWRDDPEYNLDSPDQYIEDAGRRISGETVALLAAKSLPTRFFRVTDVAGSEDEDQEMVEITKEEYEATLPKGTQ